MLTYTIRVLQTPAGADPQAYSEGAGVNADGVAVGSVWDIGDPANPEGEAVIWPESVRPSVLDVPPPNTVGSAINDAADAVGYDWGNPIHPYFYRHDTGLMEDFSKRLPGPSSWPLDINNDRIVTGMTGPGMFPSRPFLYEADSGSATVLEPLPGHRYAIGQGINEAGHVAGWSGGTTDGEDRRAFIYRDGTMEDLGPVFHVRDVNNADVIVGTALVLPSPITAFRLDASVKRPRPELLGHSAMPGYAANFGSAINDEGVVVGWSATAGPANDRAFVDIPSGEDAGFHDLQDVVVEADGWVLKWALGIGNNGHIVGVGTYQGKSCGFLLTPAPDYWLKKEFEKVREVLLGFLVIFGGTTAGGPGWGLLPGGKPVPIDPHGPMRERWEQMTEAERDFYLGLAIQHLDSIVSGGERGEIVQKAGRQIVESARKELESKAQEIKQRDRN
jgi:probable HAF family extracellular repeat protein